MRKKKYHLEVCWDQENMPLIIKHIEQIKAILIIYLSESIVDQFISVDYILDPEDMRDVIEVQANPAYVEQCRKLYPFIHIADREIPVRVSSCPRYGPH
jgi:hypothetical protein